MGQVYELAVKRPQREVLMALADHSDDDGNCWPGIPYLAWKTDYSERQVQRIIRELQSLRLVEVVGNEFGGRSSDGTGLSRRYILHLDRGVKKSPFKPAKGDEKSPLKGDTQMSGLRVTSDPDKGDIHGDKGDTQMSPKPSLEPRTNLELLRSTASQTDNDGFEEFWKHYPKRNGKKIGKDQAHSDWRRLNNTERREAMVGVVHYRAACDSGTTLAKDAFRWLRGKTFRDWQEPAAPLRATGNGGHAPYRNPDASAYQDTRI